MIGFRAVLLRSLSYESKTCNCEYACHLGQGWNDIESETNDKMAVVPYKWMINKMEMNNKMAVVPL